MASLTRLRCIKRIPGYAGIPEGVLLEGQILERGNITVGTALWFAAWLPGTGWRFLPLECFQPEDAPWVG